MSAFHRMVTYLHLYEHNIKGRNIGFAKIAKRGNACLVEIHMKNTGYSISPLPVYFYAKKEQAFPGILLGNVSLVRGNGDFKVSLEEGNLSGSGYSLEDVKGIFVPVSEETMFVSQWDNDLFLRESFLPLNTPEEAGQNPNGKSALPGLSPNPEAAPSNLQAASPKTETPSCPPTEMTDASAQSTANPTSANNANASAQGAADSASANDANASAQGAADSASANNANASAQGTADIASVQKADASVQETVGTASASADSTAQKAADTTAAQDADASVKEAADTASSPSAPNAKEATNSLKATEACPKRSRAFYRNPFALPRFPLWQPEAIQRQRPKNRPISTFPRQNRTFPNEEEAAQTPLPANNQEQADDKASKPPSEDWPIKWQFLLEHYPVMTPFAGDEGTLCIRLDLKDIRLLPKKYWYLGNNSFLLHGFFNYRYLILGMTEISGRKKWFLGIPGIFQNPERVMATLFGFPGFRNEKSTSINTGEFGYWFRYLDE